MQRHRLKEFFADCEWRSFERFVAEFWARGGWITTLTEEQDRKGANIYVEHPHSDYAIGIEVVHRSRGALSEKDVKDVFYNEKPETFADVFCILATAQFKPSAKDAARKLGCDLIDLDAWCQAVDDADDVILAHQYQQGYGWVTTEDDLLDRFGAADISISADARERVLASRYQDAIISQIERQTDPPPVVTEPIVDELEAEIDDAAPFREYPVRQGYAPAWQGGSHPSATSNEEDSDETPDT